MPVIQKDHLELTYREICQDQILQFKQMKVELLECIVLAEKLDLTIVTSEHQLQDRLLPEKKVNMHIAAYKMATLKKRELDLDIERYIREIKRLDAEMKEFQRGITRYGVKTKGA